MSELSTYINAQNGYTWGQVREARNQELNKIGGLCRINHLLKNGLIIGRS